MDLTVDAILRPPLFEIRIECCRDGLKVRFEGLGITSRGFEPLEMRCEPGLVLGGVAVPGDTGSGGNGGSSRNGGGGGSSCERSGGSRSADGDNFRDSGSRNGGCRRPGNEIIRELHLKEQSVIVSQI